MAESSPRGLESQETVTDHHGMTLAIKEALTHSHTMTPFDAPGKQAF